MGIFIIGIVLIIVGIIFHYLYEKSESYWDSNWQLSVVMIGYILGIAILIFVTILSIITLANEDIQYQKMLNTREAIEYRLEQIDNDENLLINGGVYDDIVKYNNELVEYKKWSNNFWFGWFWCDSPATLDYIELDKSVS